MATSGRKLDESTQRRIHRMTAHGVSYRTISRECDVDLHTVVKYSARRESDPLPAVDAGPDQIEGLESFDASTVNRLESA